MINYDGWLCEDLLDYISMYIGSVCWRSVIGVRASVYVCNEVCDCVASVSPASHHRVK